MAYHRIPSILVLAAAGGFLPGQTDTEPSASLLQARQLERTRQRVTYFGRDRKRPSPGQVTVEFGRRKWADGEPGDGRWDAGLDFWSTIDVNCPMDIGNKTLKPGHYYVMTERSGERWNLLLVDSAKVRRGRLPYAAATTIKKSIAIPLTAEVLPGAPRHFALAMATVNRRDYPDKLKFTMNWGPHAYVAPVKMKNLGKVSVFVQAEARGRSLLFAEPDEEGEQALVTIEHAVPEWKPARAELLQKLRAGTRWRFGQNFWTSLENNTAVSIGKTKIKPGYWFLMLERGKGDSWSLVVLDAATANKRTMDAFQSPDSKGGARIPLKTEEALSPEQSKLSVAMTPGPGATAILDIRWGRYRLTAPMELHGVAN